VRDGEGVDELQQDIGDNPGDQGGNNRHGRHDPDLEDGHSHEGERDVIERFKIGVSEAELGQRIVLERILLFRGGLKEIFDIGFYLGDAFKLVIDLGGGVISRSERGYYADTFL
jgi:hypothetical protein